MKRLTIGVPVYKVKSILDKLIASVLIYSMSDDVAIVLANNHPNDDV